MKDLHTKKRLARLRELQNQIRDMSLDGLDEIIEGRDVPVDLVRVLK